ncbi:MAG TPA: hypothetical protein VMF59_08345, partial [Bacteroidota bacterium]|nr:hypothetical protein [Bacteroidota bacterium]
MKRNVLPADTPLAAALAALVRPALCAALFLGPAGAASPRPDQGGEAGGGLVVIALGEAEENNGVLRGCGTYVTNMHTGAHDAGKFDLLFFLGDSFGPTGLNIPVGDVRRSVDALFEPFRTPIEDIGRSHVHGIPGEHDYYARHAIEESRLLGLVRIEEAPIGLTGRGVRREAAIESWTYHAGIPSASVFPLDPSSGDS